MQRLKTVLLAAAVTMVPGAFAQQYDVLIRGGRVIDGSGNPWIRADVGIRVGHVVRIGRLEGAQAFRVINASGKATGAHEA